MDLYDLCFALTAQDFEGGLSTDPHDPGNWTGGALGKGILRGSRYGISAAAFPTLDISAITLQQARAIYQAHYWLPARCDLLPPLLAVLMFDAAVNNGVGQAIKFLQAALGATEDGLFGTETASALTGMLAHAGAEALAASFMDARIWMMAGLSAWKRNRGWCRRLATLPFKASAIAAAQTISQPTNQPGAQAS